MFIQKLQRVKEKLQHGNSREGRIVVPSINNQILFLEQMQKVVNDLQISMRKLQSSVEMLERETKINKVDMREALGDLIRQASTASGRNELANDYMIFTKCFNRIYWFDYYEPVN